MAGCNHDCGSCSQSCGKPNQQTFLSLAEGTKIKHIVGVLSGKGGVGKSMVTSLLAVELAKKGYKVGILDSDITGPSIPKAFGLGYGVQGTETLMFPPLSKLGIKIMSINLLVDNPMDPVLWRGPMFAGAIKSFYSETAWEELDYLLIDMPPGTSDIALTVFTQIPMDGVFIVSTPQDLVKMIVGKAVTMCNKMNIDILGLVENMAYITCPDCGKKLYPFGPSKLEDVANTFEIDAVASLPINPDYAYLVDTGNVEDIDTSFMADAIKKLESLE